MKPCTGVVNLRGGVICPPLCTWAQLTDGTLSLADVEMFHQAMDEIMATVESALV